MESGLHKILELKYGKKNNTEANTEANTEKKVYGNEGKVLGKEDSAEGIKLMFKKMAERSKKQLEAQNKKNDANIGK
jgi:hypothetical protein